MKNETAWEVYIIQTASGKLYTGITTDLDRRFGEHATHSKGASKGAGKGASKGASKGAQFFHLSKPESIVFREAHPNRSEATKREIAIKKLSRAEKLALIRSLS